MKTRHSPLLPALLLVLLANVAHAAEPTPAARRDMISAIRQHPKFDALKELKLDVRRIWVSDKFGYVCALAIDKNGHYQMSDDLYNVYQVVLKREGNKWVPDAYIDGLSQVLKYAQCITDEKGDVTDAFLDSLSKNPSLKL